MTEIHTITAPAGTLLLDALREAGIDLDAPCGGQGTCGRCAVRVVSGTVTGGQSAVLDKEQLDQGWVLACEARIGGGPVAVEVPEGKGRKGGKFAEDDGVLALIPPGVVSSMGQLSALGLENRLSAGRPYGIAIDIGTTTIGLVLTALDTGEILSTQSDYNSQIPCGLDVISRINYARREGGLEELHRRVVATINSLINRAADHASVISGTITAVSIAGNTTMIHLFLGIDPEPIRIAPYKPTVLASLMTRAREIGLGIFPDAPVFIAPAVGSYVGGDITSGLLCTPLSRAGSGLSMFMDIGTNGEIVLGDGDFLLTCACSAGPAFEGGGISCGMRASAGAIDQVAIDPATHRATCRVIGDTDPVGVCGSGLLSLVTGLFRAGLIDAAGRLARNSGMVEEDGRRARYQIVPPGKTGHGLYLREVDIENIIRAKAAVFAACRLMLEQAGAGFNDLEKVYIAGGFGKNLDIEGAITLGLLPDIPRDRFVYLGNASLAGSLAILLSEQRRRTIHEVAGRMTYLELNTEPAYMDQYTAALFIPHTDSRLFPTVISKR